MNRDSRTVVWGYLGAVIGAGFASGQELLQFFLVYGLYALPGVLIAGGLFAWLGVVLFAWKGSRRTADYQTLLADLFGTRLARWIDGALTASLLLGVCTMFSASGAVFSEHLDLPHGLGVIAAFAVVLGLLLRGYRGLVSTYNLLVPIKVVLLLSIATAAYIANQGHSGPVAVITLAPGPSGSWWLAAILYAGYNFALAMVVLTAYRQSVGPGDGIRGAAVGGLILGAMAAVCCLAMGQYAPEVFRYQVPMLFVAGKVAPAAKGIYLAVLWLGILTTAIANTYGFAQRISQHFGWRYRTCLAATVMIALPLSFQGFARLVSWFYPLFGVLGAVIALTLTASFLRFALRQLAIP